MIKKILYLLSLYLTRSSGHYCIQENGFSWCESTQKCQDNNIEPCLPITKECIYCLTEHFGDDSTCGPGCTIDVIYGLQGLGIGTDENGCLLDGSTLWCPSLNRCIDPTIDECRENSSNPDDLCHDLSCAMFCPNGYLKDENNCDICICDTIGDNICPLDEQSCENYNYVCPKITEVTTCSEGGIEGYTTYQLSLILKEGTSAKNIYAIYGNSHDTPQGSLMFFPPAYQHDSTFNSNIGGINQDLIQYEPSLMYDSWITIGITDGDPQNLISSIGIDFDSWNSENPLNVDNGAVFLFEPDEVLSLNNEYIIGQITILSTLNVNVIVGVHGKRVNIYDPAWDEKNVIFILKPSSIHQITIPENCILWFNGCNYCAISDLNCINDDCGHLDGSHCVTFIDGH